MSNDITFIDQRQPCATNGCERLAQRGCSDLCRKCTDERRFSRITDICLGFIPGQCERTVTHKAQQLCSPCYERFRAVFRKTPYLCAFVGGCEYPRRYQVPRPDDLGLCIIHDDEHISEHPPEPPVLRWCQAENGYGASCGRLTMNSTQPWCSAHYGRWNKYGDVLNNKPIQIFHPMGTVFCSYRNKDDTACGVVAIYTSEPTLCARHYTSTHRPEKTDKCLDCGKFISATADRCQPCTVKNRTGSNHPMWKGGIDRHGLIKGQREEMTLRQNGLCAACFEEETWQVKGVAQRLSIDHDHDHCPKTQSCGECVRDLLCSRCNHVIGFAGDSVQVLEQCIEYLIKWDKKDERLPQVLAWAHSMIDRYES